MSKYKLKINGNIYNAEVISVDDNIAHVEINGDILNVINEMQKYEVFLK